MERKLKCYISPDGRAWHPCCYSAATLTPEQRDTIGPPRTTRAAWLRGAACAGCGGKSAGCRTRH